MIEKRNVARHRVLKGREQPVGIPEHFSLVLPADGLRMSCHVVWRKEKRTGIAFDQGRFFAGEPFALADEHPDPD